MSDDSVDAATPPNVAGETTHGRRRLGLSSEKSWRVSASIGSLVAIASEVLVGHSSTLDNNLRRDLPNLNLIRHIGHSIRAHRDTHGGSEAAIANPVPNACRERAFLHVAVLPAHDAGAVKRRYVLVQAGAATNRMRYHRYAVSPDRRSGPARPSGANVYFAVDLGWTTGSIRTGRHRLLEGETCGLLTSHTGLGVHIHGTARYEDGGASISAVPLLRCNECQHPPCKLMSPSGRVPAPASAATVVDALSAPCTRRSIYHHVKS